MFHVATTFEHFCICMPLISLIHTGADVSVVKEHQQHRKATQSNNNNNTHPTCLWKPMRRHRKKETNQCRTHIQQQQQHAYRILLNTVWTSCVPLQHTVWWVLISCKPTERVLAGFSVAALNFTRCLLQSFTMPFFPIFRNHFAELSSLFYKITY